jgi:predicted nucleotidyltransferase
MLLSTKKEKAKFGGPILWNKIVRNWLHQGISYMDRGELTLRLIFESLIVIFLFFILNLFLRSPSALPFIGVSSLLIAHTINWIINCNFWALLIFAIPNLENRGETKTCNYLNKIALRLARFQSIGGVLIYGSVSRGKWHGKSDIDMRILRRPGLLNLCQSYILITKERIIAAVSMQPIDMFLADSIKFLKKMRSDEIPVFLLKRDDRLEKEYPDNHEILIERLYDQT